MPFTRVTRDQFRDDGELAVVHVPTEQRYSTYPYERPEQMSEVLARGLQNERGPDGKLYDTGQISDMALVLLREKVARRSEG